jgi:hypothetical protein
MPAILFLFAFGGLGDTGGSWVSVRECHRISFGFKIQPWLIIQFLVK